MGRRVCESDRFHPLPTVPLRDRTTTRRERTSAAAFVVRGKGASGAGEAPGNEDGAM